MKWNEKKAEEIVKKHKSRFSLRLTLKILRVLLAVFILYTIYMVILNVIYDYSNIGKRTEFYQKLAIDWTYPELTTDVGISHESEISPLFTQKINIPLIRTIGKKEYIVSNLHLSKPIFNMFTEISIDQHYPYVAHESNFSFYLPYDPESGQKLSGMESTETWETLKTIHEGHVADIAFSLNNYYSPEQLMKLLAPYDLSILWMPIYMGEIAHFEEGGWGGGEDSISLQRPWGLSGAREMDDDFMSGSLLSLSGEMVKESEQIMLDNMEMMLTTKKGLAETLLATSHLQERYDYLTENGFQVYGAIVTGPVKELLKLKEIEQIHSVQLGEIEYWNWSD